MMKVVLIFSMKQLTQKRESSNKKWEDGKMFALMDV